LHTGESSKAGFPSIDSLLYACEAYAEFIEAKPEIKSRAVLKGLMTMAPFTQEKETIRNSFRLLARAKNSIQQRFNFQSFTELSMGMSNDFEIAIEEGATLVRIGTAIFGERSDN